MAIAADATVALPGGGSMPRFGLGTWRMGERPERADAEVAAVRHAVELGYRLIDTAEMYGEGGAERIVGRALAGGMRDRVTLVSKVYPHNASRQGVRDACERSRKRLGVDRIDVYLLHWRGTHPLAETVAGFERLVQDGHVGRWGVSNFDHDDLAELALVAGGDACATNQVLHNLGRRGVERRLLPAMAKAGMPLMAYTPLEPTARPKPTLTTVAARHGVSAAAVALAWVLRRPEVVAIPKSATAARIAENLRALDLTLTAADLTELDRAYPVPDRDRPLEML